MRGYVRYGVLFVALAGFFVWVILQMAGAIPGTSGIWRLEKMGIGAALVIGALVVAVAFSSRSRSG
jgi:hypothetical protein